MGVEGPGIQGPSNCIICPTTGNAKLTRFDVSNRYLNGAAQLACGGRAARRGRSAVGPRSDARQIEIWHVEWATHIQFTMACDNTSVINLEGVTAGAAYLKGIKLKVIRISHSTTDGALDFFVKPPYLPGFTVTLARHHFENRDVWKA